MDTKRWILLVTMMGVLLVTAFANDENQPNGKRSDLFKERRAYFKEQIKPKIDAQRNKLEASLSTEDKDEIKRLRKEIMTQRLIQNEFMFEARASRIKGEEVDEDLLTEIRAQRIVIENLHDEAKIIANKYRPEIDDLLAQLREERKEWRDEMRPGRGDFRGMRGFHGRNRLHAHEPGLFGPMGRGGHGRARDLGIVTFLLWDVNRG